MSSIIIKNAIVNGCGECVCTNLVHIKKNVKITYSKIDLNLKKSQLERVQFKHSK